MPELPEMALMGRRILIIAQKYVGDVLGTSLRIEGARTLLCESVAEARVAATATATAFDVIVMHYSVDHERQVLSFITRDAGQTPVLVFAPPTIEAAVLAMRAGASDVATERHGLGDLISRLAMLAVPPRRAKHEPPPPPRQWHLTEREREVLVLLVEGLANRAIGRRLGISPRTVEVHRGRVMEKSGARSVAELVRIVIGQR